MLLPMIPDGPTPPAGEMGRETGRLAGSRPELKVPQFAARGRESGWDKVGQPKAAEASDDGTGRGLSKDAMELGRGDTGGWSKSFESKGSKLGENWLKVAE
jgi:hypothetical protein